MDIHYGEKIRAMRNQVGMSQVKLAGLSGVSVRTISRMESSDYNPSLQTINLVCKPMGYKAKIEFEQIVFEEVKK